MAGIEPLGSAMSYQAQQTQPAPVVQKSMETMEGQSIEIDAPKVDETTISIGKTLNEGENGESENQEGKGFDAEMMRQAMKELTKKADNIQAEFGIHEKTNRITIKMVDKQTKEVIKELPPEKMLDMIARMWEISGLVVDEKR